VSRTQSVSEATAQKIDSEVRRIIEETYSRAKQILQERLDDLHVLAKGLLEYETLTGEEIKALLRGRKAGAHALRRARSAAPIAAGRDRAASGTSARAGITIAPEPQPGTWKRLVSRAGQTRRERRSFSPLLSVKARPMPHPFLLAF